MDNAFDKVFNGNDRINEGYTDNHYNKVTLDYFVGLFDQDKKSLERQEKILKKIEEEDFSDIEKNIESILNG
ncbi:TPA: hypothetical protein SCV07_001444 [Campylobacter lari]|uniref:hypothetical protein n=1 Tax=unclassified Campylobacter TaxID=2593542 RepID=UPI0021E687E7|nr:hypothetical protein [Campylobacter sp. CNRCH_2014_0184h]MCR8707434.1 hypothetical protein [Campylobacter sp. W0066.2]MCV3483126.1 hypothetical protein [Campylobacter sp. CNRCH_2014_0184h]HEG2582081.1 hypothetical protein [Campylobacter lari]